MSANSILMHVLRDFRSIGRNNIIWLWYVNIAMLTLYYANLYDKAKLTALHYSLSGIMAIRLSDELIGG